MAATDVPDVEKTFRREFGRAVATLVQEAFVVAVERWPTSGIPPNPGGWIVTTARNRAIDRLRREASRETTVTPGPPSSTTATSPRREDRCPTTASA